MRRLIVGGLMVAMLLFALWAERRDSEPDPGVTMLMIFFGGRVLVAIPSPSGVK
jgi:hypothetical protein